MINSFKNIDAMRVDLNRMEIVLEEINKAKRQVVSVLPSRYEAGQEQGKTIMVLTEVIITHQRS